MKEMASRVRAAAALSLLAACWLPGPFVSAQEAVAPAAAAPAADAPAAPAAMDPKARELLEQMCAYFAGLKGFSLNVKASMKLEAQGMKQDMTSEFMMAVEKPNRIAIVLREGLMGGTMVCDGTKLYSCIPQLKRYVETAAPADFDALFGDQMQMAMAVANRPSLLILTSMIQSKPFDRLVEGVTAGKYLGEEDVDGVKCRHARFEQADFDWEIWVESGDKPLLRKLVPDMSKALAQAEEVPDPMASAKVTMLETLTDWQVNPALAADTFKFTPPADATKVDSLFGDMGEEEGPHPLIGQPAPDLTLELLEGGKLELAKHSGKDVVLLDFWATWCGPCRKALPEVAAAAAEFKGKGVVLYAVNQDETPEVIREFLKGKTFNCSMALDPDCKAGELYRVNGIPQTVLIDKNGKVQAVHVGYDPAIRKTLQEQIETLLAGKDLPQPAEAEKPAPAPAPAP